MKVLQNTRNLSIAFFLSLILGITSFILCLLLIFLTIKRLNVRVSRLHSLGLDTDDISILVQNHNVILASRPTMVDPEDFDDVVAITALLHRFHHIIVLAPAVPRLDIRYLDIAVVVDQF